MSKGKIAIGAVVGAVAGIVAGFLTAPKSGKETRADIREKASHLKDDAETRIDNAKEGVVTKVEEIESRVSNAADALKHNDK